MILYFLMIGIASLIGGIVSTEFGYEAGLTATGLFVSLAFIVLKLSDIHAELIKQRK